MGVSAWSSNINWYYDYNVFKMKNKTSLKNIEEKMIKGHDDFKDYLCVHIKDWEKLKEKIAKDERKNKFK